MAEQPENQPISDEERATWVREQFQKANKFLAENGVLFESVVTEESRYLIPYLAVWKIKAMDSKRYWVISGVGGACSHQNKKRWSLFSYRVGPHTDQTLPILPPDLI